MMRNEVQNQKPIIQKECPLVADMGTPATGCDDICAIPHRNSRAGPAEQVARAGAVGQEARVGQAV